METLNRAYFSAPPGRSSLGYSEMIARAGADPRFPAPERTDWLVELGREYLRHGQISKWTGTTREADRIEGREGGLFRLTMARLAGIADSEAVVRQERLMSRAAYPEDAAFLATLYAREGKTADVDRAVDWLETAGDSLEAAGDSAAARGMRGLAIAYEGEVAAALGDTADAIEDLRRGLSLIPGTWSTWRNVHRYTLASLIRDRGDELEALSIYGSLYHSPELEALGYLQRAKLHERRGEREEALRYYGWFLDLWGDADAALQSQVELAREAIHRLGPLDS
jgi:tetratricopeptide (TPR) repeat protein